MTSRYPTQEEIDAARQRLGGFTPRPAADVGFARQLGQGQESGDGSLPGRAAGAFRSVVPQGVRDVVGFGLNAIDTPISERIGLRAPEMRGPLDEIANIAIQEATRPSNYALALGGVGVAAKLATLGRAGRVAGSLVAPISRGSAAQRVAAEAALSGMARGGAEAVNAALPERTPTPVRIALGLGGGLASGVTGVRALSGVSRGTFGRDILNIAPQQIRARGTPETETVRRVGKYLQAQAPETLADKTVNELLGGGLRGEEGVFSRVRRVAASQANLIRGQADSLLRGVGRREYYMVAEDGALTRARRASEGNAFIRDANGQPQMLQRVLQFTDEYNLTPDQRQRIAKFKALPASVFDEATAFGVAPQLADVGIGGDYVPRLAIKDSKGVDLEVHVFGTGGGLTGGASYKSRDWIDPLAAAKAGVIYADPEVALDRYAATIFKKAAANYESTILKAKGGTAADRANAGFVDFTNILRQKVSSVRSTVIRQRARTATLESQARRDVSALARAEGRLEAAGVRLADRAVAAPAPGDIAEMRARVSSLITEGNALAARSQKNLDILRPLERRQNLNEKAIAREIAALQKQIADADYLNVTATKIERTAGYTGPDIPGTADPYGASIYRQSLKEVAQSGRLAGRMEKRIERLAKLNDSLEERVDFRTNQGQLNSELSTLQRAELVEGRRAERQIAWAERNLAIAGREFRQLERETGRAATRAEASAVRAGGAAARRIETGGRYDALRDELTVARAKLKDMREHAGAIPPGRATVDLAAAPLLRGVDFEPEEARRITEFYTGTFPPTTQLGKVAAGAREISGVIVPMRAVGDMSSTLNQIGFQVFSHPVIFAKNFYRSMKDMINPTDYERYVFENEYAVSRGVAAMGEAGRLSDFEFASWADRLPVFRELQRHFRAFTTRNRIDIFNSLTDSAKKAGTPLSMVEEEQVARAINRLSGVSTSRVGDVETIAEFAPTFLRSGIETFVKGAMDGTLEGQLARQYLRNMMVEGQMIAFTAAALQGRDPGEVTLPFDKKAMAHGEIRPNPNFGTVRFTGQDISLYGRWDSLARLMVASMDSVTRTVGDRDLRQLFDVAGYGLLSKGSPLAQVAAAVATGATYEGNDPFSIPGFMEQVLPFTFAGMAADIERGVPAGTVASGAAFNWFGAKARELTPYEKMSNVAKGTFGRPLDGLTGQEKQQLAVQYPKLAASASDQTERLAARGDTRSKARLEHADADQRRIADEAAAYAKFQSGEITTRDFSGLLSDYQKRAAAEKEQVDRTYGVEYGETEGAKLALSEWYETFRQAEIAPGKIDFDERDRLEAALMGRIRAGVYGVPATAQAAIDGRKKAAHAPGVDEFYARKDYVAASGYYDITDTQFVPFSQAASRAAGKPVSSYGALVRAVEFARLRGDRAVYARLNAIQNAIERRAEPRQRLLRLRDPKLDAALVATKGLVPIRQRR